jgi:hypothetical protein
LLGDDVETGTDRSVLRTSHGCSAIIDLFGDRRGIARNLAVNASLLYPRSAVPGLVGELPVGDHRLAAMIFASPSIDLAADSPVDSSMIPASAISLLDQVSSIEGTE